jgi:hypothetical protein
MLINSKFDHITFYFLNFMHLASAKLHHDGCISLTFLPHKFPLAVWIEHSATAEILFDLVLLRSREFLWQEGHTVFATKEEADEEVLLPKKTALPHIYWTF